MRKRWYTLVNASTLSDSQTFTQNLVGVGKIYSLRVHYEATNGATSNTVANLHSMVSKLQVLDGSRVLHSLSMAEEQAINCYRRDRMPSQALHMDAAGVCKEDAFIDFWLNRDDDAHYLDTSNYTSPQISFTHALTISATAGFATGTGVLTVEALLADSGAPGNQGFLLQKEQETRTPGTSGTHDTLLPLDLPYAAIATLTGVNTKDPTATVTNLKLSIDNDNLIPYNRSTANIAAGLRDAYGPWEQKAQTIIGGTADVFKSDLYDLVAAWVGPTGATALSHLTSINVNQLTTVKTTGEATAYQLITARGWLPYGCIYLPFGDGVDPADFLDPTQYKKVVLTSTEGSADSTQVVTLQLAPR